jgi:hypothetical protein
VAKLSPEIRAVEELLIEAQEKVDNTPGGTDAGRFRFSLALARALVSLCEEFDLRTNPDPVPRGPYAVADDGKPLLPN